jgi:hypothetical protein
LKSRSKNLTYDDFRGISISTVLSKIFEDCFESISIVSHIRSTVRFQENGCSHVMYTVRSMIYRRSVCVSNGSTVNLCAFDVSKAFDKMNHCGVFVKLMKRGLPVNLYTICTQRLV